MMRYSIFTLLIFITISGFANKPASEIYVDLQKIHSLKRVLYIAAHPDDENTRALAWFSLGENAETAYLSLTRGSGGQNLIGNELSESLGVLRTQELLSARSFDGAKQFFTRAVDFGYSKSAKESLSMWGKDEVLSDVVLVIRQFRPDVIITRFPPDKRGGHGHHTASALLAIEAFEMAADPSYLPQQVAMFGTWKTTSIYWNTSYWWNKEIADSAKGNTDFLIKDIGGYNPNLGMSYNEIGTLARSEHKCQGFGAVVERGSRIEYFKHLKGEKLKESFFENNDLSWIQLIDAEFEEDFNDLLKNFNFIDVEKNIPALLSIQKRLKAAPSTQLIQEKLSYINQVIIDCAGLYLEVIGEDYAFLSEEEIKLTVNALNRSKVEIMLSAIQINGNEGVELNKNCPLNEKISEDLNIHPKVELSGPYWLQNEFTNLYEANNEGNLGKAVAKPTLMATILLEIEGVQIQTTIPVEHKWRLPSYGEKRRDLVSVPSFTASFDEKITITKEGEEKVIRMKLHSFKNELKDEIKLVAPQGWVVKPDNIELNMVKKHDEQWLEFNLIPTKNSINGPLVLFNKAGENIYSYKEIAYNHIPTQILMNKTKLQCIKLEAQIKPGKIAYINGVQDAVPAAISQLGFDVKQYEVAELATLDLSQFQSIVLGIRIYNVHSELINYHEKLYKYVENGGNLVMQYNTASRSIRDTEFGPVPFKLSRNRVTEEDAEVSFLLPEHPIMNTPNKITKDDFNGWVQERGLYFAGEWSKEYAPLFSWHDLDDDAQKGALIVAKHGKGQFVYTGISFFRELPNGVSGAYRLFANILSYEP
jgi:LmbE family N-acetylglucosaminyl deacetylase